MEWWRRRRRMGRAGEESRAEWSGVEWSTEEQKEVSVRRAYSSRPYRDVTVMQRDLDREGLEPPAPLTDGTASRTEFVRHPSAAVGSVQFLALFHEWSASSHVGAPSPSTSPRTRTVIFTANPQPRGSGAAFFRVGFFANARPSGVAVESRNQWPCLGRIAAEHRAENPSPRVSILQPQHLPCAHTVSGLSMSLPAPFLEGVA